MPSLRAQRSNPVLYSELLDCFAALAKTPSLNGSEPLSEVSSEKNIELHPGYKNEEYARSRIQFN